MSKTLKQRSQAGISVLETVVALTILLIASAGIMTMAAVAMSTTEDQGHLMARATEYAQDKMEQLISLSYLDTNTDTTVFPTTPSGGTGLAVGGGTNLSAPTASYADYLDKNGNQLALAGGNAPANWFYIRVWSISQPAGTTNLKQITVSAEVRSTISKRGALPQATVVSIKSWPF